jgi:hypothetical protein
MATDTQTEMTKTKPEIWREVHSALTECPYCHKRMSMRTLRWRHVCRRKATPQVLDAELAEQRRQELLRKVVSSLNSRLHSTTEASEN